MSQCFQATVPLVDYLINGTSGPIDYFDNKYLRTFKEFTNKYHSSTGSLDPSSVFSIYRVKNTILEISVNRIPMMLF